MAGVNQNISKMGTFFEKYVPHFMPIFKKKSHPMRPVEGLKLYLDFLCNTDIFAILIRSERGRAPRVLYIPRGQIRGRDYSNDHYT